MKIKCQVCSPNFVREREGKKKKNSWTCYFIVKCLMSSLTTACKTKEWSQIAKLKKKKN